MNEAGSAQARVELSAILRELEEESRMIFAFRRTLKS